MCLVSCIRFVYLMRFNGTGDYTYVNVAVAYWTLVEVYTAIAVACCMTLKPLVSRFCPGVLGEPPRPINQRGAAPARGPPPPPPPPEVRQPRVKSPPQAILPKKYINILGWSGNFGSGFDMQDDKISMYLDSKEYHSEP